jgi:hypothetical protein
VNYSSVFLPPAHYLPPNIADKKGEPVDSASALPDSPITINATQWPHTCSLQDDYQSSVGGESPSKIAGVWIIGNAIFGRQLADVILTMS